MTTAAREQYLHPHVRHGRHALTLFALVMDYIFWAAFLFLLFYGIGWYVATSLLERG